MSRAWLLNRRDRFRDKKSRDAGLTLAELSVTMGIASVLMIAIGVVFISTIRGVTTISVKTSTTADARITMEAMTRSLRVAYKPAGQEAAIVSAASAQITFYALLNRTGSTAYTAPNPTLVRYAYDGTCINQTLTPATVAADGTMTWNTGASTTCLARTSTGPTFSYYVSAVTDTALIAGTGLSLTDRQQVRSIGMDISVRSAANQNVTAVPLTDRVSLTNLVADDSNSDS
ncbi:hypothetical protein [Kineosporia sp. NBRC 101731]|uniref:PulJ/GspJ family protein n=1 Tax=Kineosporia sp. NBRC 101731 TaxID=3032199 RepID=UPI0024A1575F|nr:hypothetical protein [Kineosporia sp. NBRC 101731]GLY30585.1 hypothetical protein Kisp02_39500 [Kineosporia sp. NBRC 101731]